MGKKGAFDHFSFFLYIILHPLPLALADGGDLQEAAHGARRGPLSAHRPRLEPLSLRRRRRVVPPGRGRVPHAFVEAVRARRIQPAAPLVALVLSIEAAQPRKAVGSGCDPESQREADAVPKLEPPRDGIWGFVR